MNCGMVERRRGQLVVVNGSIPLHASSPSSTPDAAKPAEKAAALREKDERPQISIYPAPEAVRPGMNSLADQLDTVKFFRCFQVTWRTEHTCLKATVVPERA